MLVASGRRKSIGVWPNLSLAEARREAKRLLAEKTLGRTHPTHTAFEDALRAYLSDAERTLQPLTFNLYRKLLKHVSLRPTERGGNHAKANTTAARRSSEEREATCLRRGAHSVCLDRAAPPDRSSPFARLEIPPDNPSRSRVLTDDELRAVCRTARAGMGHFERIVALLALTGQRPREIASLQWSWIKGDLIEFPAEIAKNSEAWTIPLGPEAQSIISTCTPLLRPLCLPSAPAEPRRIRPSSTAGAGQSPLRQSLRRIELAAPRPPAHLRHEHAAPRRPTRSDRGPLEPRLRLTARCCRNLSTIPMASGNARGGLDL